RHTRWPRDWSSDVCSSDLAKAWLDHDPGPISDARERGHSLRTGRDPPRLHVLGTQAHAARFRAPGFDEPDLACPYAADDDVEGRSEERRVGKECRSRW